MSPLFSLEDRVALITGATGGLGAAIALAFADHGATVVLSDLDRTRCEEATESLRARGALAHAIPADLGSAPATQALADATLSLCGRIDVLVCNGGVQGPAGPIGETSDADFDRVMRINLQSALQLTSRVIPGMVQREGGSIILIASIAALRGNRSIGLYGLSKAALAQLARNLAVEWGPQGVRVNAIAPGMIRTPFAAGLLADEAFMCRRLAATPLRRVGEPHEIAGVAVMLASPAGGFVTGHTLVVDGGTTISDGS